MAELAAAVRSRQARRFAGSHVGKEETMKAAPPRRIATRIARLGTETAFAVSAEAAAFAAAVNEVYPFRLGDLDIAPSRAGRRAQLRGAQAGAGRLPPNDDRARTAGLAAAVGQSRPSEPTLDRGRPSAVASVATLDYHPSRLLKYAPSRPH